MKKLTLECVVPIISAGVSCQRFLCDSSQRLGVRIRASGVGERYEQELTTGRLSSVVAGLSKLSSDKS
jgi:hypothetical protein